MQALTLRQRSLVGLTLFAMFFGAGNLIFPPWLGVQAGTESLSAFIGFLITAVGFPILGVMAVAESGGLKNLGARVHPVFHLSLDRPLPGDSAYGEHLVRDGGAAASRRERAARSPALRLDGAGLFSACLFSPFLSGGFFGSPEP